MVLTPFAWYLSLVKDEREVAYAHLAGALASTSLATLAAAWFGGDPSSVGYDVANSTTIAFAIYFSVFDAMLLILRRQSFQNDQGRIVWRNAALAALRLVRLNAGMFLSIEVVGAILMASVHGIVQVQGYSRWLSVLLANLANDAFCLAVVPVLSRGDRRAATIVAHAMRQHDVSVKQ
jgi:hypothetical protein